MRRSLADATTAGAAAALLLLLGTITAAQATQPASLPVIFDTDIGTDIDDAYALAALMGSADLELVGVTTVSGDAVARASGSQISGSRRRTICECAGLRRLLHRAAVHAADRLGT